MAEVAPSAGGGGGNRNFLLIIGGLAALLFIGLLALGAIFFLPALFGGGTSVSGITATPTRISIPPTPTRTPQPTATNVVNVQPTLVAGERRIVLEVDANNSATLTTQEGGKSSIVQKGKWTYDAAASQLTFTFTEFNGKPFPDEIVINVQGSSFTVVSYNKALHGDLTGLELKRSAGPTNFLLPQRRAGLAFPNTQATATPDPLQGDYSGTIPGVSGNQRVYTLVLIVGGAAAFNTAETAKSSVLQLGAWSSTGNEITVNLTDKDGSPVQETLVFTLVGTDLVGRTFDQAVYGTPFILQRDPSSPPSATNPAAGTYSKSISLDAPLEETATPIAITATPIAITATPEPGGTTDKGGQLPDSGLGEDLLLLFGGGILLLGIIVIVRRMRSV